MIRWQVPGTGMPEGVGQPDRGALADLGAPAGFRQGQAGPAQATA
ncbi:hypothetical protein [Streptomyces sp. MMG1121]|nr:hypothetical protein [Streptomyces sp. MMG1121]